MYAFNNVLLTSLYYPGIFNHAEAASRLLCPTFSDILFNNQHAVSIHDLSLSVCVSDYYLSSMSSSHHLVRLAQPCTNPSLFKIMFCSYKVSPILSTLPKNDQ